MKNFIQVFNLIFFFTSQFLLAQGTGDTNISLFGNISPSFREETEFMRVSLLSRYDQGKNNLNSISPMLRLDINMNEDVDVQIFLTSKYAMGDLKNGFSVGDLNFIGTYHLNYNHWYDGFDPTIDFGFLLTVSGGRGLRENRPKNTYWTYPMEYQSSLGTVDVYLGYTYKMNNFNLSVGYQHPILKQNFNNFFPSYFGLGDINKDYPPSNEMNRSGDFYSRIGYNIIYNESFFLNLGFTSFYRIANSRFYVGGSDRPYYPTKGFYDVPNTKGLALNGVLQSNFKLNNNAEISLYAGIPLIHRKNTIDGLFRSFFITPAYSWYF